MENAHRLRCVLEFIKNMHMIIEGKPADRRPINPKSRIAKELLFRMTNREFISRNITPKEANQSKCEVTDEYMN